MVYNWDQKPLKHSVAQDWSDSDPVRKTEIKGCFPLVIAGKNLVFEEWVSSERPEE